MTAEYGRLGMRLSALAFQALPCVVGSTRIWDVQSRHPSQVKQVEEHCQPALLIKTELSQLLPVEIQMD